MSGATTTLPGAAGFHLGRDVVEIWQARLDGQPDEVMAAYRACLSADEEQRAGAFYFERDRRRFVAGRAVLRHLLGAYTRRPPGEIRLRYGGSGKPALAETGDVFFNLAHSEGLALYAFTRVGEVGIDLERIRDLPEWPQIAASCFSHPEQERLAVTPAPQRRDEFFRAWTRQEALLKATGVGLGALDHRGGRGGAGPPGGDPDLRIYPLQAGAGYTAALAVGAGARRLVTFDWSYPQRLHREPAARRSRPAPLADLMQTGAAYP